jgi:hypothetical protein
MIHQQRRVSSDQCRGYPDEETDTNVRIAPERD